MCSSDLFIDKQISFLNIHGLIQLCLDAHDNKDKPGLEDIFAADLWARDYAKKTIEKGLLK